MSRIQLHKSIQHVTTANGSNEECADILKEVISECQSRIENCDEGVYTNS